MPNLIEAANWEPGIYQLEVNDPVMGGANGIDNLQAKQLAARTNYLNAAIAKEATARANADTAEIARANAAYLPLAGNAAQVVSVAAPTANGHAVRIVGYANFSVSAGVLTVHKQVGMTLGRAYAGAFPFTFAVAQPDSNWTCAINQVRALAWANSGGCVTYKTANGATLAFVENNNPADPAATVANASSIIVFAS